MKTKTCLTCKYEPEWVQVQGFFQGKYLKGKCSAMGEYDPGAELHKNKDIITCRCAEIKHCNLWQPK